MYVSFRTLTITMLPAVFVTNFYLRLSILPFKIQENHLKLAT